MSMKKENISKKKWRLSENMYAEDDDDILLVGMADKIEDNIICNIARMEGSSFVMFTTDEDVYDSLEEYLNEKGYDAYIFDAEDPESDSIDIFGIADECLEEWKLPRYFYLSKELEDIWKEDGKAIKKAEFGLLFSVMWYCICEYDKSKVFSETRRILKDMANEDDLKKRLSIFYEYEDKNNHYSPITEHLKRLEALSRTNFDTIIAALFMRVYEFEYPETMKKLSQGDLGLRNFRKKPTAIFVNMSLYRENRVEQMVAFTIIKALEQQTLDREKESNKGTYIPAYIIVNEGAEIPWNEFNEYLGDEGMTKVVGIRSEYDFEMDIVNQSVDPRSFGSWICTDPQNYAEADLLSHRGGFKCIYKKPTLPFLKPIEESVRKIQPHEILQMGSGECYVVKFIGDSYEDIAVIDKRLKEEDLEPSKET